MKKPLELNIKNIADFMKRFGFLSFRCLFHGKCKLSILLIEGKCSQDNSD